MILSNAIFLCVFFSTYLSTTIAQNIVPSNDSSPYVPSDPQCILTTPYPPHMQSNYPIEPLIVAAELKQDSFNVSYPSFAWETNCVGYGN